MEAIADNLDSLGKSDSADFLRNELDHQIKLCLVDVLKASNHVLLKRHGYFDLLGCDFMLSASNKLSMLEINTNPSLTLGMDRCGTVRLVFCVTLCLLDRNG